MPATSAADNAATSLASQPAIDQQAAKPERKTRISKRLREVIHLVTTGECATVKAAAERVGMHPNYLYTAFKKPEVRVFAERAARESIARGLIRASARLNELVDASSEHVSLDATKHLLAIEGIKPAQDAQVSVNIDIKAGYVIDLSEPGERPMRDITALASEESVK